MTKDKKQLRNGLTEKERGRPHRFLAEEDEFDAPAKWRLASWGLITVAVLAAAFFASRSSLISSHLVPSHDQAAATEPPRQTEQVELVIKDSQSKVQELAATVEKLGKDRDRLMTRVAALEQGLDSVTGSLPRQQGPIAFAAPKDNAASQPAPQPAALSSSGTTNSAPPGQPSEIKAEAVALPKMGPAAAATTTPPASPSTTPAVATPTAPTTTASTIKPDTSKTDTPPKTVVAAISPATSEISASTPPDQSGEAATATPARRTDFGVDLGGANSVEGLRAVWRGALKSNEQQLTSLQPIIVVKERHDGFGIQLRLVAGPLADAAEAAKVCASLNNHGCETAIYEGQRLSLTREKHPDTPRVRR